MGIELVKRAPGEALGPVVVESVRAPWGHLAVAISEGVVVAAAPGTTPTSARSGLAGFAEADSGRTDVMAERFLAATFGEDRTTVVPVGLKGTPFQQDVWEALTEVPRAEVITYSDLAREVGRPGATRAVASVCAANRVGLAIPCHRVIRSNGSLGGYRWGDDLKGVLIEFERQVPAGNRSVGAQVGTTFRAA